MLDAVRRALRAPEGRLALVLHLSRLPPPAPRPHHGRVARALLDDEAARQDGQVFAPGNGDLVLLCRPGGAVQEAAVPGLAATLARLFRRDAPDPAALTSLWPLAGGGDALLRYAEARLADAPAEAPAPPEPPPDAGEAAAAAASLDRTRLSDLVQRQTAVVLAPGGVRLRPLFRELTFSAAPPDADPFLLRHLAGRLDRRLLQELGQDPAAGPMGAGATEAGSALHLNLTLAGVLSDGFARFAAASRAAGLRVGAEVALLEACADPAGFLRAQAALREAGVPLVLDGVAHHALPLIRPAALRPDLVKLDWSPRLPDADVGEALLELGASRIVLDRADDEAAMSWGLARGIRRFQGRHVDAILAASRLAACPAASGCTLRQCAERAKATGPAGRAMCPNPALLDAGAPPPAAAAAA